MAAAARRWSLLLGAWQIHTANNNNLQLVPTTLPHPRSAQPQGGPLAVMKPKYAKTVRKLGFKTRRLS